MIGGIMEGTKAEPVEPGGTELPERLPVTAGAVTLMAAETILRMEPVDQSHPLVPHDLGDDRGAGDGQRQAVAAYDGDRSSGTAGRHEFPIDENQRGGNRQLGKGAQHRLMRGGVNADPVDLLRPGRPDPDRRATEDRAVSPFAGLRGQAFGIVDEIGGGSLEEDNGARDHRTGERTAAGFIHAGQMA